MAKESQQVALAQKGAAASNVPKEVHYQWSVSTAFWWMVTCRYLVFRTVKIWKVKCFYSSLYWAYCFTINILTEFKGSYWKYVGLAECRLCGLGSLLIYLNQNIFLTDQCFFVVLTGIAQYLMTWASTKICSKCVSASVRVAVWASSFVFWNLPPSHTSHGGTSGLWSMYICTRAISIPPSFLKPAQIK